MKTVLIIDDSMFMRRVLKDILSSNEFNVVGEAENGQTGLDKYQELKPDLVTMDVTMGDMNGIEVLARMLKADPSAKVVMVSSMGQEIIVKDAIKLGAKGFIVKPFEERQIVEALTKIQT